MKKFSMPVRICLCGEDLDWLGFECCAIAINLQTHVVFSDNITEIYSHEYVTIVWQYITQRYNIKHTVVPNIKVINEAPIASGLSSSTSFIMALLNAFNYFVRGEELAKEELISSSFEIERRISGCGGMDQTIIGYGGCLLMKGSKTSIPEILGRGNWPEEFGIILIDSKNEKSTKKHIDFVKNQLINNDKDLTEYISLSSAASLEIWEAIHEKDLGKMAENINKAHCAMRDLQKMSTPNLEVLRTIALASGCKGVKISGAGGGGCLFGVVEAKKTLNVQQIMSEEIKKNNLNAEVKVINVN